MLNKDELLKSIRCAADIDHYVCTQCPFQYAECTDSRFIDAMKEVYILMKPDERKE